MSLCPIGHKLIVLYVAFSLRYNEEGKMACSLTSYAVRGLSQ